MNSDVITTQIMAAIQAMSGWELLAAILALVYLVLAIKERIECWYAAFVSTAIYTFLFWDVDLLMESALQIYYLLMAVYGWWQWRHHATAGEDVRIHRWPIQRHIIILICLATLVAISGYLLAENTSAALPYVDSLTTWGAVITTYMVAKKILENWLYWIVIDAVSVYLYIDRGLYLTTLLFVLYVIMAVYGFIRWRQVYRLQET